MTNDRGKKHSKKTGNRTVRDTFGSDYRLTDKLGEGGQGIVCTTDRPGVLVKLLNTHDRDARRRWVNRVNWIMNQELGGLHIARPMAVIERPLPGYVMELMDGLETLQKVLEASHLALSEGNGLQGYVDTGGLDRRLALLRELASTLADLHGRGLAFGDLSPANIFVSASMEHHQLWLIDCDNLCASERPGHGHLHTPGYGAPEVVRGEAGVNSLTDAWSFAVIAFELLTHNHPFRGIAVIDGDPDEEDARALRGEMPWIHHPDDRSNEASGGIPMEIIATPRMQGLFNACFDTGRDDPLGRPSMAEWADALDAAWATTLSCEAADCASSFFWNDDGSCPFCDNPQPDAVLLKHAWFGPDLDDDPDADGRYLDTGDQWALSVGRPVDLHLAPVGTRNYREAPLVCTLTLDVSDPEKNGLKFAPHDGVELGLIRLDDAKEFSFRDSKWLKLHQRRGMKLALHLNHPDFPQLRPAWRFTW